MKTKIALVSSGAKNLPLVKKPAIYGSFISAEERKDLAGMLERYNVEETIGSSRSEFEAYMTAHRKKLMNSLEAQPDHIIGAYPGTFAYLDGTEICTVTLNDFYTDYLYDLYRDSCGNEHIDFYVRNEFRRIEKADLEETGWTRFIRFGSKVIDNITGDSFRVVETKEEGRKEGTVGVVYAYKYEAYCALRNAKVKTAETEEERKKMLMTKRLDELHTGQIICIRKYFSDAPFPADYIYVRSGDRILLDGQPARVFATTDYHHFYLITESGREMVFHIDEFADWCRDCGHEATLPEGGRM